MLDKQHISIVMTSLLYYTHIYIQYHKYVYLYQKSVISCTGLWRVLSGSLCREVSPREELCWRTFGLTSDRQPSRSSGTWTVKLWDATWEGRATVWPVNIRVGKVMVGTHPEDPVTHFSSAPVSRVCRQVWLRNLVLEDFLLLPPSSPNVVHFHLVLGVDRNGKPRYFNAFCGRRYNL